MFNPLITIYETEQINNGKHFGDCKEKTLASERAIYTNLKVNILSFFLKDFQKSCVRT